MGKIIGTESKNVIKNIAISVVTTVAGAFAVYFLGFKDSGKSVSKLEMEARTIEGWKTLVAVENIYAKNSVSLLRDAMTQGNFMVAAQETEKESQKFQNSLRSLIDTEGIDADLKSLFERRLENDKSQRPYNTKLYEMMDQIVNRAVDEDWTEAQVMDTITARLTKFAADTKGLSDRSINDIETMANVLSERYDHPFSMNDFLIVQAVRQHKDLYSILDDGKNTPPERDPANPGSTGSVGMLANGSKPADYFPGVWDSNGAKIYFERDGSLRWVVVDKNTEVKGTWTYEKSRLKMKVTNPQTSKEAEWEFNLAGVEDNSFAMVLTKEPYNYYQLVRK